MSSFSFIPVETATENIIKYGLKMKNSNGKYQVEYYPLGVCINAKGETKPSRFRFGLTEKKYTIMCEMAKRKNEPIPERPTIGVISQIIDPNSSDKKISKYGINLTVKVTDDNDLGKFLLAFHEKLLEEMDNFEKNNEKADFSELKKKGVIETHYSNKCTKVEMRNQKREEPIARFVIPFEKKNQSYTGPMSKNSDKFPVAALRHKDACVFKDFNKPIKDDKGNTIGYEEFKYYDPETEEEVKLTAFNIHKAITSGMDIVSMKFDIGSVCASENYLSAPKKLSEVLIDGSSATDQDDDNLTEEEQEFARSLEEEKKAATNEEPKKEKEIENIPTEELEKQLENIENESEVVDETEVEEEETNVEGDETNVDEEETNVDEEETITEVVEEKPKKRGGRKKATK